MTPWANDGLNMFLIVLCLGNLLSSGLGVALILSKDTRSLPLRMAQTALFCALSTLLPALQWTAEKLQARDGQEQVLVIDPSSDGLLLWFQKEFIRNKLFLLETIQESCFQV